MERVGVPRSLIQTRQASSGSSFTFFVQLYTLSLILGFATETNLYLIISIDYTVRYRDTVGRGSSKAPLTALYWLCNQPTRARLARPTRRHTTWHMLRGTAVTNTVR